ncbi:MAG: hypothetical protein QOD42_2955 [Sphingomonadales bacterium]|jgi:hypothetical protein|nr:hypothetical protein [Sphingomonadales bacterium]
MSKKKPADLDAWLAALDHPRKAEVAALVAIALAARPGITGHVKWNAPSFVHAGDDRVTLGLRPNAALRIVFHRGAKAKDAAGFAFADDSGLIRMVAPDRGVVTLGAGEVAAKADALGRLIARWVEAAA